MGARCAHARAGVGAVASQNVTDPSLGPKLLDLMERGATASEAVGIITRTAPHIAYRQLSAVDAKGGTFLFSGANTLGTNATAEGRDAAAAGNLLANPEVPQALVSAFEAADGALGSRLISAMRAALAAGGEVGPVHSAGLLLVRNVPWPVADLRIDWTETCPIEELAKLWDGV